jgi:transcriptional regulator with XRE-family HTH domain
MSNPDELDAPQTPNQLGVRNRVSEPPDARGEHQTQPEPKEGNAHHSDAVILGQALAVLRTLRGLSQKQLATLIGTANTRLSSIEAGRDRPRFDIVQGLLRAMRFSLSDLEWAQQMVANPDVERPLPRRPLAVALNVDLAPIANGIGTAITDWLLSFPPDAEANLKARKGRRRPGPPRRAHTETGRIDARTKAGRALRNDPRISPSQVSDPRSI